MNGSGSFPARSRRPYPPQTGFSLLESVVSLLVASLILPLALRALGAERRMLSTVEARGAFLESMRITRAVVGREIRSGGGRGAFAVGDSIPIQAYRGWALICPIPGRSGEARVGRLGIRGPNPEKDSLVLPSVAGAIVVALIAVRADSVGCGSAGVSERWLFDPPIVPDSGIARYFERGSLHISGGALRYRRGRGGRQPLTPAVLHIGSSGLSGRGARRLRCSAKKARSAAASHRGRSR